MRFSPRAPPDDQNVNVTPVHPLREFAVLWLGLSGVALAIFLLLTLGVELAVSRIPPALEAKVFGGILSEVPKFSAEAELDPQRLERARELLDRLAGHWPEAPYRFRLGVIPGDEPNAMAVPGGAVLVTAALLEGAETENELAFVLGHELGHFRNRDHLRRMGRGFVLALMLSVLSGGLVEPSAPALLQLVDQLAGRTLDRSQELEADRFGLTLVAAEYGHVAGSRRFFEKLEETRGSSRVEAWLSTHPATASRLEELERFAGEQGLSAIGEPAPLP